MLCKKCDNRVTEVVNDITGIAGTVNLKKGTLTVSCAETVPDSLIQEKLRRAGDQMEAKE